MVYKLGLTKVFMKKQGIILVSVIILFFSIHYSFIVLGQEEMTDFVEGEIFRESSSSIDSKSEIDSIVFREDGGLFIDQGTLRKNTIVLPPYVRDEIIIKFKEDPKIAGDTKSAILVTKDSSLNEINYKYGVKNSKKILANSNNEVSNKLYNLKITKGNIEDALEDYKTNPLVEYAHTNRRYYTLVVPNDPLYSQQWAHKSTRAEQGWDIEQGNSDIVIAIIDTGVDYYHEDLEENMLGDCTARDGNAGCPEGKGYDFVDIDVDAYLEAGFGVDGLDDYIERDNDPMDVSGHGTHVAGIAVAGTNNQKGISGVCWKCKIMPLKAGFSIYYYDYEVGLFEDDDIIAAIYYAVDHGARIISMSFGGSYVLSESMKEAFDYAYNKGVVLVAAAGNSGSSKKMYPAAYEKVIAVTAIDSQYKKAWFSNYGYWTDVAAPGKEILSSVPKSGGRLTDASGYLSLSGTSMAAPYVSGIVGLLLSKNPELNPEQIRRMVRKGIGFLNQDSVYVGAGRVSIPAILSVDPVWLERVEITSLEDGSGISQESIALEGIADWDKFILFYGEGNYPRELTQINVGSRTRGVLTNWDVSRIADGYYTLRLTLYNNDQPLFSDYARIKINNNIREGWPVQLFNRDIPTSIAFFDVNYDGTKEIIVGGRGGFNPYIHLLDSRGNLLKRLLIGNRKFISSSPAIGDIDKDGDFEIVVGLDGGFKFSEDGEIIKLPGEVVIKSLNDDFIKRILPVAGDLGDFSSSPVLADLDKDGKDEIIISSTWGYIYVFRYDGTLYPGWPVKVASRYCCLTPYPTAAVGDIDNDGKLDIVVGSSDNKLYAFNSDGRYVSGIWPVNLGNEIRLVRTPVIGDLDSDGNLEIVVTDVGSNGDAFSGGKVSVLERDGSFFTGWPKFIRDSQKVQHNIALGDVDLDGKLEIAFGWSSGLYLFNADGNLFPTFPLLKNDEGFHSPIIGDFNGDNQADLISVGDPDLIVMHNSRGEKLWQSVTDSEYFVAAPIVDDIDNDGKLEVGAVTFDGVYIWNINSEYDPANLEWPMFQHDAGHTGNYHTKVSETEEEFIRGDANGDRFIDIGDAIFILNWIFRAAEGPDCWDRADVNDDGMIDISDVIYLLLHRFQGGQTPPAPYPREGIDPTLDNLGC